MEKKSFFNIFESIIDAKNTDSEKDSLKPENLKWSEFIEKTGNDIDKKLIAHARKEGLIYIGGKCRFTATESEQDKKEFILNVDAELYFKDQFKAEKNFQIYPLHTERCFKDFDLNDEDTTNQLKKIKVESYEFNIETPQLKEREE
jgi:hypothetical protein